MHDITLEGKSEEQKGKPYKKFLLQELPNHLTVFCKRLRTFVTAKVEDDLDGQDKPRERTSAREQEERADTGVGQGGDGFGQGSDGYGRGKAAPISGGRNEAALGLQEGNESVKREIKK